MTMIWTKLTDVMPPKNTPVLICARTWLSGERIICAAAWHDCGGKPYWNCDGASGAECDNDFDQDTITHWMPLPTAPDADETKGTQP